METVIANVRGAAIHMVLEGPSVSAAGVLELVDPKMKDGSRVRVPFTIQSDDGEVTVLTASEILAAATEELQRSGYQLVPIGVFR